MAKFEGNAGEFHQFIGPKIRNAVNNLTRNHRKSLKGICQECGKTGEIESAHVQGKDRKFIIETILTKYKAEGNSVICDLKTVENEIMDAHNPIESVFKFLCKKCHNIYDAKSNKTDANKFDKKDDVTETFAKLKRIEKWAKCPKQMNHKIVIGFLKLEEKGVARYEELKSTCLNNRDTKYYGELPRSKLRSIKDKKTKTAVADVTFYNLC